MNALERIFINIRVRENVFQITYYLIQLNYNRTYLLDIVYEFNLNSK